MSAKKNRTKLLLPRVKIIEDTKVRKHTELTNKALVILDDGSKEYIDFKELKDVGNLGSGTFGQVKKMIHMPTRLNFAVKLVRENLIDTSESRDIEVSIRLGDQCENLIRFYGALFAEEHYWILTEAMDTSLDCFFSKAFKLRLRLPESFHSLIAQSVLNALCYMKEYRLMHRDIKPSNILLNSTGEIKVCDYGICGFLNNESLCKSFKGCQLYMSPEKLSVENGYSIKSDVWSLGIMLIEIATGIHPYSEFTSLFELTTHILEKESPELDRNKFSEDFCDFVDDCLIKKERKRPSLKELLNHPFIERYQNKDRDKILTIIRFICDEIKKDNLEDN